MRNARLIFVASAVLMMASGMPAYAQAGWKVVRTFPIGGPGGWDYLTPDPDGHRLFVPRSTHTMVISTDSGKILGDIPGQKIAHGVAIVPSTGRGFISDGGGSVVVFDLKTYAVLGRITTLPDSDGIIYDPSLGLVLFVSGDDGKLMSFKPDIDTANGKMDEPIDLGGAPEFLASDGAGKVYINLMDKNEVAVVDMKARKVVARWPVSPGGAPVGMSIDTQRKLLVIGCRKPQKLIVMSTVDGKVLADLPIGTSVDAIVIDHGQLFASCRDGSLSVAREKSPGKFEIVQVVTTHQGASTMALDPKTDRIYLPAAESDVAQPNQRPRTKPDSFMIVVVSQKAGD
ncbi:MAG: YncE family protein [Acidobacteriota bacterium]|nr:YncE family protein [Acidobacteriota bacterium]